MDYILEIMRQNEYVIIPAAILLLLVLVLGVLHSVHKTNRRMEEVQKRVEGYLEVILNDAEEMQEEETPVSRQEEQMRLTLDRKKKQQEEAVFKAVLEEIFP